MFGCSAIDNHKMELHFLNFQYVYLALLDLQERHKQDDELDNDIKAASAILRLVILFKDDNVGYLLHELSQASRDLKEALDIMTSPKKSLRSLTVKLHLLANHALDHVKRFGCLKNVNTGLGETRLSFTWKSFRRSCHTISAMKLMLNDCRIHRAYEEAWKIVESSHSGGGGGGGGGGVLWSTPWNPIAKFRLCRPKSGSLGDFVGLLKARAEMFGTNPDFSHVTSSLQALVGFNVEHSSSFAMGVWCQKRRVWIKKERSITVDTTSLNRRRVVAFGTSPVGKYYCPGCPTHAGVQLFCGATLNSSTRHALPIGFVHAKRAKEETIQDPVIQIVCLEMEETSTSCEGHLEIHRMAELTGNVIVLGTEYIRGECEVRMANPQAKGDGEMIILMVINLHEL